MVEEKRKELFEVYQKWETELKGKCSELINKQYSHPYYLYIPDDWYQSTYRILIIGEEGYGEKECDLPIKEAQEFNGDYLLSQLDKSKNAQYAWNGSSFWRRIRSIVALMKGKDYSLTWTNLDMIHHSIKRGNCRLNKKEREALHSTPTKILNEEIRILKPTCVVYFGWYGVSLKQELPDVFSLLYPEGLGNDSQWKEEKMAKYSVNGVWHIFTYHPNWGCRQRGDYKGYEDKVLKQISETLMQGLASLR